MSNLSPKHISEYPEQRLAGLRRHAAQSREVTYSRLSMAIQALSARGEPITVHTIRAESGLDYKSYARNPEAKKLFQEHSTFLVAKRKKARTKRRKKAEEGVQTPDPLLNYKRSQLAVRLRLEMQRREEIEQQYRHLLEEHLQADLKVMQLEAELAKYQSFLDQFRSQVQQKELSN